ncbi:MULTISPECIES: hypothetical protein [unclassified Cryobacterium]|uniref:hypothetical protein n=1 Tax=unclassified Cryobacterium TaxID=2649013 RepID=UPI002AB4A3FC|nr:MULTISPECIES: hypothetical protein [Cryobacterium]MDY7526332.1 hypothetical protein [Cryobacterium sp. 10C2]MDY7557862.1 hypothetical protein [Cryobacterium sp. 10C3]MEB0003531.1 hypothetical protein [Cryobacterium sp. RTC2.1]MEB0203662.1 hypothetical protein [Cryobacterium sp. 5I3]MEB0288628.1 hypothetical protein [Cryobacterium sp. 10S3]
MAAFAIYSYNDLSNLIHRSTITMSTASATPGVPQNTGETKDAYTDRATPLQSGSIPCVE